MSKKKEHVWTRLDIAMKLLMEIFDEFAKPDGENEKISKEELADLLRHGKF